ncbi:Hypothetical predicted protein [Podarcis lilfordi]|uniref:Uncharacterized protein n=1 Tax=Podarcis lilfordi TaxID=74358 RepID=A0AA35P215_9SAUR|nr:Hypothetical predicted protein [Podarcis lilfordi]
MGSRFYQEPTEAEPGRSNGGVGGQEGAVVRGEMQAVQQSITSEKDAGSIPGSGSERDPPPLEKRRWKKVMEKAVRIRRGHQRFH